MKKFHRRITRTILFLPLLFNFSCSYLNNDNRTIVNIINRNEKELLQFRIPSQEKTVHENFEKYKVIKLKLLKKYFSHEDFQDEVKAIGNLRHSLGEDTADMYSANINVFNNKIIEVILEVSKNNGILQFQDAKFLKEN